MVFRPMLPQWILCAAAGLRPSVTIAVESVADGSLPLWYEQPDEKQKEALPVGSGRVGPSRPTTYPGENMRGLADAEASGVAFTKKAGVSSLAELRKVAPDQLPAGWGSGTAWPIIDGWVIPGDQPKLYEAGKYNDVTILVGYNSDEGLSFSREKTPEEFIANTRKRYGPFADKLLAAYPVGKDSVPKTARDLLRDAAFGWHTWSWARLQAWTGKSKVFYYYFDQHQEHPAGSPEADHGMTHGMDVPYVFQTLDPKDSRLTPGDRAISEAVSTYWTNFAKHGDPNGPGVPAWPEFAEKNRQVMYVHDTAFPGRVPGAEALEVLIPISRGAARRKARRGRNKPST